MDDFNIEEHRLNNCAKKIGYYSKSEARINKKRLESKYSARYRIYKCRLCNKLHLTTIKEEL